jgi:hypothetical protein
LILPSPSRSAASINSMTSFSFIVSPSLFKPYKSSCLVMSPFPSLSNILKALSNSAR